jgi:hypothetical protein
VFEGHYIITGKGTVHMWPARSGIAYTHPLVELGGASLTVKFGWYSIVNASGHTSDLSIISRLPTGFSPKESIQTNYFRKHISTMVPVSSLKIRSEGMRDPWNSKTL